MAEERRTLLVIGASEAALFKRGRRHIREQYGLEVVIDSYPGRPLEECLDAIKRKMNENTQFVMVWALTPWAWMLKSVPYSRPMLTVFQPNPNIQLGDVPPLMTQITEYVGTINPSAQVFLVLPALKDMYTFNQTRLRRELGPTMGDFLKKDPDLNPHTMREHSIRSYKLFLELLSDTYQWPRKKCLRADVTFSRYFPRNHRRNQHKQMLPHTAYLRRRSLALNLSIMPDGLHGNLDFLTAFMKSVRSIFRTPVDSAENPHEATIHSLLAETYEATEPTTGNFEMTPSYYLENLPGPSHEPPRVAYVPSSIESIVPSRSDFENLPGPSHEPPWVVYVPPSSMESTLPSYPGTAEFEGAYSSIRTEDQFWRGMIRDGVSRLRPGRVSRDEELSLLYRLRDILDDEIYTTRSRSYP